MKHIWPIPKIDFLSWAEIEEPREITWIYTRAAWEANLHRISLPVNHRIEIVEATEHHWNQCQKLVTGEVIYAVGGGLSADAAKYIAAKKKLPLVILPTALSADAFLTWASGIRLGGSVRYIETRPADVLVIDFSVLAAAPPTLRAAGICDVLSIATGRWDWRYAQEKGANPPEMQFIPYVDAAAKTILDGALDCAEAAGRADPDGLKQLLDCLALEVQVCNQIGHSRPEEGSEHYFAYSVENMMGKGLPHGDLVGPGIVLIAHLQGQDAALLRRSLEACHIALNRIPDDEVHSTLADLPAYCRTHNLPHGIAHDLTEEMISRTEGCLA